MFPGGAKIFLERANPPLRPPWLRASFEVECLLPCVADLPARGI